MKHILPIRNLQKLNQVLGLYFFFVGPKVKMCSLIEVYNSGLLSLSPTLIYHLINGLIIVRILVRSVSIENYYCYRNYFRRDKININ